MKFKLQHIKQMEKKVQSPMMIKFNKIKSVHPDAVLLLRAGNTYQLFADDALEYADVVDIPLNVVSNGRGDECYTAGFPEAMLDHYMSEFDKKGIKVVVIENMMDPKYN